MLDSTAIDTTGITTAFANSGTANTIGVGVGPGSGVASVIPGSGVTCTPLVRGTCVGAVTLSSTGGGGTFQNSLLPFPPASSTFTFQNQLTATIFTVGNFLVGAFPNQDTLDNSYRLPSLFAIFDLGCGLCRFCMELIFCRVRMRSLRFLSKPPVRIPLCSEVNLSISVRGRANGAAKALTVYRES